MNSYDVIRRPVITEKSTQLSEGRQYVFEVAAQANKIDVKRAVEEVFSVRVRGVNISHVHGKARRLGRSQGFTASWKKAVVSLHEGDKIQLFEGM